MDLSATPGLGFERAVDPARYAAGGIVPRLAVRPLTREEVAEALRAAARDHLRVLPWGGGMALSRAPSGALPPFDLALDLSGLNRVTEYEPADFTFTAECGVTLATLRGLLAARSQELPLEAAHADRATLGGVLAANASGPRRLRLGSPRDRILGARFALGDGGIVRTGGKVVKNVAGYGIHRMLCGSRGGLAVLLEASLKLAPAPEARAALIYHATAAEIADAARWAGLPRLEPAYVTVVGAAAATALAALAGAAPASGFIVAIGLEDDAPWVEVQRAKLIAALGAPIHALEAPDAAALAQALADLEERAPVRLSLTTASNTPAALAPLLELPEAGGSVFHAPAGRLHLEPDPARAQQVAGRLAEAGFALIGARGVPEIQPPIPAQAVVLDLRRRIRESLDPGRAFAMGDVWERGAL